MSSLKRRQRHFGFEGSAVLFTFFAHVELSILVMDQSLHL